MAVKIPIVTVFDSKGLRQAQYQLNKVSGNISNLSRNFAIAGAAFAGIAVGLGKSVKIASDLSESINAVNVAFGSSAKGILDFGKTAATTLGVSSLDFNNAAVRFSAFAERIVGSGKDATGFIRDITTRASDFASVFNIDVSEALQVFQSGLAGEAEPLKRFGINLLDTEVKAFAVRTEMIKQGETMTEQQKVLARYGLLMESTNKTAGDFANTSSGLANASRILNAQIVGLQGEIGDALLPAIEQLMPVVQDLTFEFGDKLKTAVNSVDWASLLKSIADLIIIFVTHIETITKVVTGLYLLNTAYNIIKVTSGLVNVATTILGNTFTITAGKIGLATGAVKLFRTALITTGIGALVVGLGFVIEAIINTNNSAKDGTPVVTNYGGAIRKSGADAEWAASRYGTAAAAAQGLANAAASLPKPGRTSVMDDYAYNVRTGQPVPTAAIALPTITTPTLTGGGGGGGSSVQTGLQELIADANKNAKVLTKQTVLAGKGLSAEVAAWITSSSTPVKAANEALARINKNGQKAVTNLTNAYKRSSAGQQAAADAAAATAKALADAASAAATDQANAVAAAAQAAAAAAQAAAAEMAAAHEAAVRAAEEAARAEAAALAERLRVFKSFQDSVKGTFAGIRDSILQAFSLPALGGSTNSIIRNIDKLLARMKSFSSNITKLSDMGLDPKLLQQVINAGPVAGAKLAANLVAGGVSGLSAINRGFADIGGVAGEIAMTGTQAQFGGQAQQNIYNVNINGGLDSSAAIGRAVVDAVRAYERTSGAVWQGA